MQKPKIVLLLIMMGCIISLIACKSVEPKTVPAMSPIQTPCPSSQVCLPCPTYICPTQEVTIIPSSEAESSKPTPTIEIPVIPYASSRYAVIESTPESVEGWKSFVSDEFGFRFSYPPFLNNTCCNIGGPGEKLIVLADEETVIWGSDAPFSGLGIYIEDIQGQTIEEYLTAQQEALLGSFMEYTHSRPREIYEILIRIDNKNGVLLGGYSYRQPAEYIYIPLADRRHILCIVKGWGDTERFDSAFDFDQVLSTFKFVDEE